MSLNCAVVLSLAFVAGCTPAPPASVVKASAQPGAPAGAGDDYYYFDGKPVRLDRAASEFVVGVTNGADVTTLVGGASAGRAGDPMMIRGRRFVVVTLDPSSPSGSGARWIEAARARSDVWFVSPVYYQPATRARVVPTDELIVRTKPTTTPDSLLALLKAKGLRQVSLIEGTTDQHLLRIESAKNVDVLRVARELYDSGLFQWAEPDFVQELRRQG